MNQMSNELVSAVDAVSVVIEENAASTRQMAASSVEVSQAIENIASVSEENSAAVEEISASAEEMDMQAEESARAAQSLADMAHELQGLVSQFKLDAGTSNVQPQSGAAQRPAKLAVEAGVKTATAQIGARYREQFQRECQE
jgi:hypothetical protein